MAPLMMLGSVPLYNVFAVIVLTFEAPDKQGQKIGKSIIKLNNEKNVAAIPAIMGIVFFVFWFIFSSFLRHI